APSTYNGSKSPMILQLILFMFHLLHICCHFLFCPVISHPCPTCAFSEKLSDFFERQFPKYPQGKHLFVWLVHFMEKCMYCKSRFRVRHFLQKQRFRRLFLFCFQGLRLFLLPTMVIIGVLADGKEPWANIPLPVK